MYVIIQLYYGKSTRVKSDCMDFIFFIYNQKDCSKSIVQSICFHNKLSIRNLVYKDGSKGKYLHEGVESIMTREIKLLEKVFLGKVYQ